MKKTLITLLILSVATLAYCAATQMYLTFNITNDDGQPVVDAKVEVFFLNGAMDNRDDDLTNVNGTARLAGIGPMGFDFRVTKEGYYKSIGGSASRNQSIEIVLREIRNPIAMYAKKLVLRMFENPDDILNYDFIAGDFLPPYGSGTYADIEISGSGFLVDRSTFESLLSFRFLGKGNGMKKFRVPIEKIYSEFDSAYQAPQAGYSAEASFYRKKNGSGTPLETNYDSSANYYFRIRAVLDEEGNVVSALYGKMYGEFNQRGGIPYYVNPTPNDRNMEFDWRQNLFRDVPPNERVTAP